ncbi:protein SUPPRESSOR OF QUENCHING 1 [Citrus sinensis]|uniref:Protein SUPPRESSOR OF QUENCHING 1 n=1 Tax=Citrus sinensis TaxID=2711 RepID=A0ACB8KMK4_CITSI|nr:protein SUPPRESSOR OF QUENCHING 1 [Citrus sinensis]
MIAMKLLSSPPASSLSLQTKLFFFSPNTKQLRPSSVSSALFQCGAKRTVLGRRMVVKACVTKVEETDVNVSSESKWGKVSAVLFDMDGVLCNSEEPSRRAAVDVFAEMGVEVTVEDFLPFMGTGEANFLGGVASVKGVKGFDSEAAKKRFFEIYLDKCKSKGLKVAVASSADRIKVDANLAAAGLPVSMFDAIVSADAFENLKPAPDIFLSASKILNVPTSECIVIEDALAGVQAAKAAQMRCIAVTTTLSEERLKEGSPSLIRKEIGSVSLNDILTGGDDEKIQEHELLHAASQNSTALPKEKTDNWSILDTGAADEKGSSTSGLQGSRREILRYGSLGVAFSCLFFAVSNWKAMQYASPKAIWNVLFGVNRPSFEQTEGGSSQSERIQQFVNYISDVENRKTTPIVPEFPAKLDWLNTAPLQFRRDLKGKVVVLDFWTYCCINCMHVLPDLEFLEKKYKDMPFTVVGVHSAKFDNEKDLEAIHNAVLRYGISHPVVNDGDMNLWRELGVNSWPTFAVVGPNGKLLAQLAGEGHRKDLDDLVEAALLFYGKKKLLDNTPLPLSLEKDNDPRLFTSPLKFPGKLAIDILNNRLFISDSNHNRIVVTDLDGNFIVQIGSSGEEGLRDGSFDDATFNRPQGLAYNAKKNLLYVADTENHALREIDFVNDTVRTLAGNGTKETSTCFSQLLNSPWDVCYKPINEKVYIAMAGQHQIWEHSTVDGVTRAFSGDGYERNLNGSSSLNTSFAQPSGISLSPDFMEIYVADSESSSIRALNLKTGGSRLLAGGDPIFPDNLFKFGDRDGMGSEVLLQHPLGVYCAKNGQIYVADSYNHKIKKLDPASNRVSTLAGIGKAGFKDGAALAAQLSEPAGIIEAQNGNLFIADTNNNIIRYLDLNKEEPELQTLELKGVQPPTPKSRSPKRLRRRSSPDAQTIVVDGGLSNEGNIYLKISLPEEYHFSKEARSKFSVDVEPENAVIIDPLDGNLSPEGSAVLHFRRMSPSVSTGRISCKVYYCKEDEVCLYKPLLFEVPFQEEVPNSPPAEITLPYDLKPKILTNSLQLPVAP